LGRGEKKERELEGKIMKERESEIERERKV
jgi:hypothetical protein